MPGEGHVRTETFLGILSLRIPDHKQVLLTSLPAGYALFLHFDSKGEGFSVFYGGVFWLAWLWERCAAFSRTCDFFRCATAMPCAGPLRVRLRWRQLAGCESRPYGPNRL